MAVSLRSAPERTLSAKRVRDGSSAPRRAASASRSRLAMPHHAPLHRARDRTAGPGVVDRGPCRRRSGGDGGGAAAAGGRRVGRRPAGESGARGSSRRSAQVGRCPDSALKTDSTGTGKVSLDAGPDGGQQRLAVRLDGATVGARPHGAGRGAAGRPSSNSSCSAPGARLGQIGSPGRSGRPQVTDQYGNPVPGQAVRFRVSNGGVSPGRSRHRRRRARPRRAGPRPGNRESVPPWPR